MDHASQTALAVEELAAHVRAAATEERPRSYTARVPLAEGTGKLRVPITIREDHLTPEDEGKKAVVQAGFEYLHVLIPSDREPVLLRLPLREPVWGKPYLRSIDAWRVNVSRWAGLLETNENGYVSAEVRAMEPTEHTCGATPEVVCD